MYLKDLAIYFLCHRLVMMPSMRVLYKEVKF